MLACPLVGQLLGATPTLLSYTAIICHHIKLPGLDDVHLLPYITLSAHVIAGGEYLKDFYHNLIL